MRGTVVLLALFAVSGCALGSFELLLTVDQNSDSIRRFDPVTGTALGSFGSLQLTDPQSVKVSKLGTFCYVMDYGDRAIKKFNYNTGEYLGSIPSILTSTTWIHEFSNGDLLLYQWSSSFVRRVNSAGTLLNSYPAPGGALNIRGAAIGPAGEVYVAWAGTNRIHQYSGSGVLGSQSAVFASPFSETGQMEISGSFGVVCDGGSGTFRTFATGNPPTAGSMVNLDTRLDYAYSAAFGHGDLLYIGGIPQSGNDSIQVLNRSTMSVTGSFGSGTIVGMDIVVAPEPGSLVSLGLGGIALLVSKRRNRT